MGKNLEEEPSEELDTATSFVSRKKNGARKSQPSRGARSEGSATFGAKPRSHKLDLCSWLARPSRILIIEDTPADAFLVSRLLKGAAYRVRIAESLETAFQLLAEMSFDLVLTDLSLPDAEGIEAVEQVIQTHPDLPLVVLSGSEDESIAIEAVRHGAQDFLLKGTVNEKNLSRVIRYSMERKRYENRLEYLAQHDPLTSLANRRLFEQAIELAWQSSRESSLVHGVALIDLDRFKEVNDALGHEAGDALLCKVASSIVNCYAQLIEKHDLPHRAGSIARLGGDEFAVVFEDLPGEDAAQEFLTELSEALDQGEGVESSASIGASFFGAQHRRPEEALKAADHAMYEVKRNGGRTYRIAAACPPLAKTRSQDNAYKSGTLPASSLPPSSRSLRAAVSMMQK